VSDSPRKRISVLGPGSGFLQKYGIIVISLLFFVGLSLWSETFFSARNLTNLLDQSAVLLIIACTQTLVIIAGGFDLSVGAIFALSGIAAATTQPLVGTGGAILIGILAGTLLGLINALLVTKFAINTFIATLASSFMFYGLAQVFTRGRLITVDDASFAALGNESFLGIRYSAWVAVLVFIAISLLLNRTTIGRSIFSVGSNAEAARLSGVRVDSIRGFTFVLNGAAAGLAGVVAASRISQAQANVGDTLALTTIAAVVLGGTSILGGQGAVWRTIFGLLLLTMISNGFNLLNLDPIYQQIATGAVIVLAVASYSRSRRVRSKRSRLRRTSRRAPEEPEASQNSHEFTTEKVD